ncbi:MULTISPECIES: hypothetical protein [Raoultella]|uniref:hypothetical protein n=1 Tax=Raoultella TaxID=160674 RepID=UPI00216730AD|nr:MULTISPECIES: hypothetical protein [Raoultella]MCS4273672.1 hypothetical protein [Raoultella sp. BIGb0132]MCS4290301.1 hypothetical protein [Raoultella terrigena]
MKTKLCLVIVSFTGLIGEIDELEKLCNAYSGWLDPTPEGKISRKYITCLSGVIIWKPKAHYLTFAKKINHVQQYVQTQK